MTQIPGTQVTAVFQHVDDGSYPELYYGAQENGAVMASMNAGNSQDLYVGGGGINAGFKSALKAAHQDTDAYQNLHVALADNTDVGQTVIQQFQHTDPAAAMALVNARVNAQMAYTGLACLDVFDGRHCPHGNTANRAMIYIAPPYGPAYPTDRSFLSDVSAVGKNAVAATVLYNAWAQANSQDVIAAIRLCMYSSSIYLKPGVALDDVALAIFAGVEAGLTTDATGIAEVQMPVGNSPPYFKAVQKKLSGS